MQTYELLVSGRSVRAASVDTTLVRTSIGIDQVHVLFDNAEWLGFPITATFGMGDVVRTAQAIVSEVDGEDWVAETTVTIPHEVIRNVGRIRVTFQGTDSQGRHIITAYGAPLSVVEAGDVEIGGVPEDAPTVDEWQQMRADAQRAINDAQSLVNNLQSQLDSIVSAAEGSLDDAIRDAEEAMAAIVESTRPIATESALGMVMVGDGLNVTEEGVLSSYGLTQAQRRALANLIELASKVTDADVTTTVQSSPRIDPDALPIATPLTLGTVMPDGTTIQVDDDGMIHANTPEVATTSQTGVVKPDGTTITIDADGTIHGNDQVPVATTALAGKVKPDGTTITVAADGTISGAIATSTTKGMVSVPTGNGLYVSNGILSAYTATEGVRGMVQFAYDGGLVNDVSSRLMVRDATNEISGKVVPDAETVGIVDGKLSVVSGTTEVRHTTPFSYDEIDHVTIRLAEDGVVESLAGGAIQFSFDYDYGIYGSGTSSSGFSLRQMFVREGDLADEARINPDSSVTVVRNTAAILLRGAAPYDTNAPYNLTEYQRYWSQLGVEKTQADLEAFVVAKAAELSGDATISTVEDANAYFSENPYTEVRPLSSPVSYSSGRVFSGPLNAVYRLKDIQGYPGPRGLGFEWWWSEYEFVIGFPVATGSSRGVVMPDNETISVSDGTISVAQSLLATIANLRRRVTALEGGVVRAEMVDGYLDTPDPMADGYLESDGTIEGGYLTY